MKGRGVRSLDADALRRVSASAEGAKSRFVLIDAVGVERSCKTDSQPLEKKPGVPLKDLLLGVAMGSRDDDTVTSLANRLLRLAKTLDPAAQARLQQHSGTGGFFLGATNWLTRPAQTLDKPTCRRPMCCNRKSSTTWKRRWQPCATWRQACPEQARRRSRP